ncbi:MAG TPA: hypothetical protein VFZ42_17615 [Chitinophagaceae bacterium]
MSIPAALNTSAFLDHIDTIRMLYEVDEDFKTLCDDYSTSLHNVEKFKGETLHNLRSELEYQQLTIDLQKEILEYVKRLK